MTGSFGGSILGRHLAPTPRVNEALWLADNAAIHAAIDVSDGLLADLTHLCRASGVRAELELARVPTLPGFAEVAEQVSRDAAPLMLSGGDDYEVLFTAAAELPEALGTRIGTIVAGPAEVVVFDAQGQPLSLPHSGFDHFR